MAKSTVFSIIATMVISGSALMVGAFLLLFSEEQHISWWSIQLQPSFWQHGTPGFNDGEPRELGCLVAAADRVAGQTIQPVIRASSCGLDAERRPTVGNLISSPHVEGTIVMLDAADHALTVIFHYEPTRGFYTVPR